MIKYIYKRTSQYNPKLAIQKGNFIGSLCKTNLLLTYIFRHVLHNLKP